MKLIKNIIPEGFKVIPSFPDFACNKEGEVRSIKTGKCRKPHLNNCDILVVPLNKEGEPSSSRALSYVICETFNNPCPYKKRKIAYKDLNPDNMHADNLYWKDTDLSDNIQREKRAIFLSKAY